MRLKPYEITLQSVVLRDNTKLQKPVRILISPVPHEFIPVITVGVSATQTILGMMRRLSSISATYLAVANYTVGQTSVRLVLLATS